MKSLTYIKEKWQDAGFQKYLKNTSWMILAQGLMVISFAVNIWVARYLGPEKFGTISYVFAFVGLFGFLAGLGLNDILIRDLVKNPEKKDEILGTSFGLLSVAGFVAFLVIAILSLFLESSSLVRILIIMYATSFLFSPVNVISAYFQARVEARKNAVAQIIGTILVSIFKIILIILGKGIFWITFAYVLDFIIGSIIYFINYKKSGFKFKTWSFSPRLAKELLSVSWLLMLYAVAGSFLFKIDQVMIRFYLGNGPVGLYAAAVRMSEIWYFVPAIICSSLFPAIVNAHKNDKKVYADRLKKLFWFLGISATLISIPVVIFAPFIIKTIYGAAYALSTPILQIYVWSGISVFLGTGLNRYFLAENKLHLIFYYNLMAAIINIVLNIIFIPKIGLYGAAWATFISYAAYPILAFIFNLKNLYKKEYAE